MGTDTQMPRKEGPSDGYPENESNTHVIAGALFLATGAAGLIIGSGYPMGTATRMGPGYFPSILCGGLALVGVLLMIGGWRQKSKVTPTFEIRPAITILLPIIVFGFGARYLGLFVTCILVVLITGLNQSPVRWGRQAIIAVALSAFCTIIFGYLLNLSIPMWPRP